MREVFHQSLEDIQNRLVEIAERVSDAIDKATTAFENGDVELAESVIESDEHIDELATSVDELAINLLARQQPVARDLRIIVSALRASASLERMGDLAEHIAQLARSRFPERAIPRGLKGTFLQMGALDVRISQLLVDLLRTQDLAVAGKIRDLDDEIDELHASVYEKVLSEAFNGDTGNVIDAALASRYHERFGDHAVSIAKKMVYLATGDWTGDGEEGAGDETIVDATFDVQTNPAS